MVIETLHGLGRSKELLERPTRDQNPVGVETPYLQVLRPPTSGGTRDCDESPARCRMIPSQLGVTLSNTLVWKSRDFDTELVGLLLLPDRQARLRPL